MTLIDSERAFQRRCESCTLLMAEMKTQSECADVSEPIRKLPFIGKQSSLYAQRKELPGASKQTVTSGLQDLDTSTELKLYFALQRRHVTLDMVNLLSCSVCQEWLDKLMSTLVSHAPSNFNAITLTQVMRADRDMLSILASSFKGSSKAPVGGRPPLDNLFEVATQRADGTLFLAHFKKKLEAASSRSFFSLCACVLPSACFLSLRVASRLETS